VAYAVARHEAPAHKTALAPVAFTGVVRNLEGKPVDHAWLQLTAMPDMSNVKEGVGVRIPMLAGVYTDAAGRFTIRQPVSRGLRRLAAGNGGWVNFQMEFRAGGRYMPWGAPRKLSHGRWLAEDNPDQSAALKQEQLTLQPFAGGVDVLLSPSATQAQEKALGPKLRHLPNVIRVWFVSKEHARRIKKWNPGLANADQWVVTTASLSVQAAVGEAICGAHYPGVEPCGAAPGTGGVQWSAATQ
jgi:hypothetical protein